jgi:hypothetical protein
LAAALGETGALVDDAEMLQVAEQFARDGVSLQRSDGVLPEKGGNDVNYQALGLLYAARYVVVCRSPALVAAVNSVIRRGLDWEATKVDRNGIVSVDGNTRTGVEQARNGQLKQVEYRLLIQSFSVGSMVVEDPHFNQVAYLLARGRHWLSTP